jgi:N-formylglutamate amidohydrolase
MKVNKNIAFDTLNQIDLFSDKPFDNNELIFHIPHSSSIIPDKIGYVSDELIAIEIQKLTDWHTDIIFNVENTTKLIADFSRVYCDVERFENDLFEPMSKFGRGFFYTHTDNGELLRNEINSEIHSNKCDVLINYYRKHHNKLNKLTQTKLDEFGKAIIIDCHSFTDVPFNTDLDKTSNRPDICIGTDDVHTPENLKLYIANKFRELEYSVEINSPYVGTIVPIEYYSKNNNVQSIMIEINRKLYMNDNVTQFDNVRKLNNDINYIFQ